MWRTDAIVADVLHRRLKTSVSDLRRAFKMFRHVAFFADGVNHLGFKNESKRTWQQIRKLPSSKGSLSQSWP